jgi:alpha-beta hydrolase superfamily lysophospholipase
MFISIYQAGQWALEHASEFSLPLLLMHGGDDKIISVKASHEFANTKTKNCTLKIWDGLYHEIHNEPEKEEVFRFLIDWLDKEVSK